MPYRNSSLKIPPRLSLGAGTKLERRKGEAFPHCEAASRNQTMQYAWYDFAGNIGVALMVLGYLLLQAEKIRSSDLSYSLMNGIGALLVVVSLLYRFNLSAFLVESFWFVISVYGLIKFAGRGRAAKSSR